MATADSTLAGLPAEITLQILQHVASTNRKTDGDYWPALVEKIPKGESLRAIQSVRLTCRALSQIAAPILFPVVRVSFNHQSIANLEQMSENSFIAAHVRGVVVNVAAFRSDMASNIALFKKTRFEEIEELFNTFLFEVDMSLLGVDLEDEEIEQYDRIDNALDRLRQEWDSVVPTAMSDDGSDCGHDCRGRYQATDSGAAKGVFGDILLRSHKEYAQRHRQQLASLHDTQAMRQLARAIARLSCRVKLHISAEVDSVLYLSGYGIKIADILDSDDDDAGTMLLYDAMVQPSDWQDMQDNGAREASLHMVPVLSRLPVPLVDAGASLTELYVSCFPRNVGFEQLRAYETQTVAELELQLRSAFTSLQVFNFGYRGMNVAGIRKKPLPEADMAYMRAYLRAAVTASSQLRTLILGFHPYGIHTGSGNPDEILFAPGPLFGPRVRSSGDSVAQLSRVRVNCIAFKSSELASLLSRLGTKMVYFSMYSVKLLDGRWAPLLDAVRDKTSQRCQDGRCDVCLSGFLGAEFGDKRRREVDISGVSPEKLKKSFRVPPLTQKAMDYVCGRADVNPLTKLGVDLAST